MCCSVRSVPPVTGDPQPPVVMSLSSLMMPGGVGGILFALQDFSSGLNLSLCWTIYYLNINNHQQYWIGNSQEIITIFKKKQVAGKNPQEGHFKNKYRQGRYFLHTGVPQTKPVSHVETWNKEDCCVVSTGQIPQGYHRSDTTGVRNQVFCTVTSALVSRYCLFVCRPPGRAGRVVWCYLCRHQTRDC